jgi:hypothetical protein
MTSILIATVKALGVVLTIAAWLVLYAVAYIIE